MEPVAELLSSPRLALMVERLSHVLSEERARRARFYAEVTEDEKAEFINGRVVVHSPVKLEHHEASFRLAMLMRAYTQRHALGFVGHEKLLITLTRNDYEPDVSFWRTEVAAAFTPKQMQFPAPDFVAEVLSPSTALTDRTLKLDDYAAHGITEYWIVDPDAETVEQYVLAGEAYALRVKSGSGEVSSVAVVGFTIPVRALFDEAVQGATLRSLLG